MINLRFVIIPERGRCSQPAEFQSSLTGIQRPRLNSRPLTLLGCIPKFELLESLVFSSSVSKAGDKNSFHLVTIFFNLVFQSKKLVIIMVKMVGGRMSKEYPYRPIKYNSSYRFGFQDDTFCKSLFWSTVHIAEIRILLGYWFLKTPAVELVIFWHNIVHTCMVFLMYR